MNFLEAMKRYKELETRISTLKEMCLLVEESVDCEFKRRAVEIMKTEREELEKLEKEFDSLKKAKVII